MGPLEQLLPVRPRPRPSAHEARPQAATALLAALLPAARALAAGTRSAAGACSTPACRGTCFLPGVQCKSSPPGTARQEWPGARVTISRSNVDATPSLPSAEELLEKPSPGPRLQVSLESLRRCVRSAPLDPRSSTLPDPGSVVTFSLAAALSSFNTADNFLLFVPLWASLPLGSLSVSLPTSLCWTLIFQAPGCGNAPAGRASAWRLTLLGLTPHSAAVDSIHGDPPTLPSLSRHVHPVARSAPPLECVTCDTYTLRL